MKYKQIKIAANYGVVRQGNRMEQILYSGYSYWHQPAQLHGQIYTGRSVLVTCMMPASYTVILPYETCTNTIKSYT